MSILEQMLLPAFINLSVILLLASYTKGGEAVTPNNNDTRLINTSISSPQTTGEPSKTTFNQETLYVVVFAAAAALVIILLVGVFLYKKHKRSAIFTREDSYYYANFSQSSADLQKKETSSEKPNTQDNKQKSIDEAVYVNIEVLTAENNKSEDHAEPLYGNVYSLKD